jgi:sigma-B regulation protein RsbU (phosphoserine phosphatase)
MAALTALPLAGLSLFLLVAINVFEKDKIAYVFDSSLTESQTRAARVKSEIESNVSLAQSIVASYRGDAKTLDEAGGEIFRTQAKIIAFQIYAFDPVSASYQRAINLSKAPGGNDNKDAPGGLPASAEAAQGLLVAAKGKSVSVKRATDRENALVFAARFGKADDPKHVVALALFDSSQLAEAFSASGAYTSFLLQGEGELVFGEASMRGPDEGWSTDQIWARLGSARKATEGIAEISSPSKRSYLASYASVGQSDLSVVSLADKRVALRAIDSLLRTSILFFIATASLTTIFSVFAARGLTSALSALLRASQQIAGGDFATRVAAKGSDEIGRLAASFNVMAEEVSRLMKETAEKARMESELATAKTVQETLFPPNNAILGSVEVAGHYEPASECGGDWWHYRENGDFVYLWIGDATGHGAPAALITSAARAVASVIDMGAPRSPAECIGVLNRAIWDASKGKMMMTFFLGALDKRTGMLYYANASHEAPLLLHKSDQAPSRDDYVPLNEVNNPRLGENPNYEFKEAQIQLAPGDRIILYTDGVVDVKGADAKAWGERRFLKALGNALHGEASAQRAVQGVVAQLQSFRGDRPLDDDVMVILADYKGAA